MKTPIKFALVVALQTVVLVAMIVRKQTTLSTGTQVILETKPIDPRDLFRGDYVRLYYEISEIDRKFLPKEELHEHEVVYLKLNTKSKYANVLSFHRSRPEEEGLFIRGRIDAVYSRANGVNSIRVRYGIEQYFVPEGKGMELERPKPGDKVTIRVAVDESGNAGITGVLVNDKIKYEETLF